MAMSSDPDHTKAYLIENTLEFIPAERLLRHRVTQHKVILHSTVSSCLLLLLQEHNSLVTQDQLLRCAWGEKHRKITHNAFYQCILNLRKSFVALGVETPIVTTIPRKGLMITEQVSVEEVVPKPVVEGILALDTDSVSLNEPKTTLFRDTAYRFWAFAKENYGVISFGGMVMILLLNILQSETYDTLGSYTQAGKLSNNCTYFFNDDAGAFSRHEDFLKRKPEICTANKYVYVTAYENIKSLSVMICTKKLGAGPSNRCSSIYYPENN